MAQLSRKTSRLRFGRLSAAGAKYFVTFCTQGRVRVLTEPQTAAVLLNVLHTMNESQDIELFAATVMPDHIHLIFALGVRLRVGQVNGKIKTLSSRLADWRWQDESFEHQIRLNDSIEDYGFYIFMNPYRAGLCRLDEGWPWWVCPRPDNFRFLSHIIGDVPVPEVWIGRSKEIAKRIVVRGCNPGPSASDGPTQDRLCP